MINPFEGNELCDGKHCACKETCARWMMRPELDLDKCTPYINFNTKPIIHCAFWLQHPNENYPLKTNND